LNGAGLSGGCLPFIQAKMEETKTNYTYEVAVVGGGLAGLALAIELRMAGKKVVLFEKEQYPFHRVCGEYISMESYGYLAHLGVPFAQWNLPHINQLRVSAPSGNILTHTLKQGGIGVSRYKLDHFLANRLITLGGVLFENTKVIDVKRLDDSWEIITDKGILNATQVVGSWGKRSNLDVKWNRNFVHPKQRTLNNFIGIKYHVKADLPKDVIELHNFKNGYCGISAIEDERYCMCYLTTSDNLKNSGGDIKKMESNILQRNPHLKKYFNQFESHYDKPIAISQISFESKTQQEQGICLIGDASGLITPLCGNGMSMAMHAAHILAKLIVNQTNESTVISEIYSREWKAHFDTRLKTGRFIQSLFGNEILTNITISVLGKFPKLVDWLISKTHGDPFYPSND